jgi:peptidoglycan-associated lipoprotein
MNKITFLLLFMCLTVIFFAASCKKQMQPTPADRAVAPASEAPPAMPQQTTDNEQITKLDSISNQLQPIFFDYDKYDIRTDQQSALQTDAKLILSHSDVRFVLEGHCDERGTEEYNLALGEQRARATREYLMQLGVDQNRVEVISYGKTKPFAEGHSEDSWKLNRRAHPIATANR